MPAQVQKEFIKNRENVIDGFYKSLQEIPGDFQKVLNGITGFHNEHKGILADLSEANLIIHELLKSSCKIEKTLSADIENYLKNLNKIKYHDGYLDTILSLNLRPELAKEEFEFLDKEFKEMKKRLPEKNQLKDFIFKNHNEAFPGAGDIAGKDGDEIGDYVIFHEIMRFMKEEERDAVFLTFDTTKGDWMKSNRHPLQHYVLIVI